MTNFATKLAILGTSRLQLPHAASDVVGGWCGEVWHGGYDVISAYGVTDELLLADDVTSSSRRHSLSVI
jgi:hypothetical protein